MPQFNIPLFDAAIKRGIKTAAARNGITMRRAVEIACKQWIDRGAPVEDDMDADNTGKHASDGPGEAGIP
jgi:hypothetical protein